MELKISVKTILLFTALFILGTMILGFYSCSSNTTPVSPQLVDEFTDDGILGPGDGVTTIVNEDGTITIIDPNGDTTTITTPGTTITDDGTTVTTYIVTIDAEGNLIIIDAREGAAEPGDPEVIDLFELEFSTFVQNGELWTGNAIITNNSNDLALLFPRIAFGVYGEPEPVIDGESGEFNTVNFLDTLVNPDIYFGLYRDRRIPAKAYPTIFIADEDESYTIDPGEAVEHEITVRFDPAVSPYFEVNLLYKIVLVNPESIELIGESIELIGEIWEDVPLGMDIEFVEYIDEVSRIAITLDANLYWGLDIITVIVEESLNGERTIFVFSGYNEFDLPVYTGAIDWNPAEDGPVNVMAYFRIDPEIGIRADSFMDFTTLTP